MIKNKSTTAEYPVAALVYIPAAFVIYGSDLPQQTAALPPMPHDLTSSTARDIKTVFSSVSGCWLRQSLPSKDPGVQL